MATQSDLEKLRKQLSDLDAKLKSMRGNSPQRDPRFDLTMANQNYANLMRDQQAKLAAERGQFTQGRLMGAPTNQPIPPGGGLGGLTSDQAGISPEQRRILDDLMARQAQQPIPPGGGMGGSIGAPENMRSPNMPQDIMAAYNNFLQQGIQRSNTMNQDAATNFANMQAGAPTTEPATPSTAKPTMPVAGLGMQKSKAIPLPKTFSTRNTPSARFG